MSENKLGMTKQDYVGSSSTLCVGCGHDSITNHIITACFDLGIDPLQVAKLSGIGCSSKTPAYFMSQSHGFNSIHGRMAPLATGVHLANPRLKIIGISGDGDTASIGLSGFIHLIRRNVPMVYIVENNGVYGLTKGQFSATADQGSESKLGSINPFQEIDICKLAILSGASFVARSFSGDAKQLVPILKAALTHPGTAVIDILSPCITFNNHDRSTLSFDAVKKNKLNLQNLGFISESQPIETKDDAANTETIKLHDGSYLVIERLNEESHNVHSKMDALQKIEHIEEQSRIATGLFYLNTKSSSNLCDALGVGEFPLSQLGAGDLSLGTHQLNEILDDYR